MDVSKRKISKERDDSLENMSKSSFHVKKRCHSRSSSSSSSRSSTPKKKRKKKKSKSQRRKSTRSSSSSSSSSGSDDEKHRSLTSSSKHKKKRKKKRKKSEKKKKSKDKQTTKSKIEEDLKAESSSEDLIGPSPSYMSNDSRKPLTKEEWEKQQSVVRKVYDEETGRNRLIRGSGEVVEEIVSYKQHKDINRAATFADGRDFQKKSGLNNKR